MHERGKMKTAFYPPNPPMIPSLQACAWVHHSAMHAGARAHAIRARAERCNCLTCSMCKVGVGVAMKLG